MNCLRSPRRPDRGVGSGHHFRQIFKPKELWDTQAASKSLTTFRLATNSTKEGLGRPPRSPQGTDRASEGEAIPTSKGLEAFTCPANML